MAIIPAHNEAAVIANLVESLKAQDYPQELLDIYVIADNCTDKTAEIARDAGAIVYERFDATKKTKGYAMQWFLKQKIEENADYDAFCVFDADNVAMPDFIKNMNKKLCQGEEVVQGYRDIKNKLPNKDIIDKIIILSRKKVLRIPRKQEEAFLCRKEKSSPCLMVR